MIIRFSAEELGTLKAMDPNKRGPRPWKRARDISAELFKKSAKELDQGAIRTVRNAFRRLAREGLIELHETERGQYRITDKGRKLHLSGDGEVTSVFERGEATKSARDPEKRRGEARTSSKKSTKKATKKATKKDTKKAAKKTAKKTAKKKASSKRGTRQKASRVYVSRKADPETEEMASVVEETQPPEEHNEAPEMPEMNVVDSESVTTFGGNGERFRPRFKRREALKYADRMSGD